MSKDKENENKTDHLSGLVNMINSINKIKRKDSGYGNGKPQNNSVKLFEISTLALIAWTSPQIICSLTGYTLQVNGRMKTLKIDELDRLYFFVKKMTEENAFEYFPSYFDFTICDGSAYTYFVNWNGIISNGEGGNTMPDGLKKLIDYCNNILND